MARVQGILWILFFIVCATAVIAAHVCPVPERIIFRISGATNAHGEMAYEFDGTPIPATYDHEICWYLPVELDIIQYTCLADGSNMVVNLSSMTNAHGQDPDNESFQPYPEASRVCYGDISCISCDARNAFCGEDAILPANYFCPAEYTCVVQLSNWTNAHMRACVNNNADYPITRCCKPTAAGGVAVCGNGILEPGEECDAGDLMNNDPASFCSPICERKFCSPY